MCQPVEGARFCGARAPSITCVCDPTHSSYAAYGLRRGSFMEVMGPEAIAAGMRSNLQGYVQGRTAGDPAMMPGTFAVDQDGVIQATHYARHSGDQPDLTTMLAALRA